MANCNIVRYLSALICIQLVSLTNLYIISISPPIDVDNNGGTKKGNKYNRHEKGIAPAAQEQVMRDKGKTVEQIIAERDLIQAKLNQARRQNMLKDRKLRSLEQQQQQQQQQQKQRGRGGEPQSNDSKKSAPPGGGGAEKQQLAQIRQQLDDLQKKHDDKDRKLRLAKDELKSSYSNFLLHVPETVGGNRRRGGAAGSQNDGNDNNNDGDVDGDDYEESSTSDSDHAPLLTKLQQHRVELQSALTKYRVCHHSSDLGASIHVEERNAQVQVVEEDVDVVDDSEEEDNNEERSNQHLRGAAAGDGAKQTSAPPPDIVDEVFDTWEGCWLHTMEKSAFSFKPARRFVVVRNPLNHVPSLYRHCRRQQLQQQQQQQRVEQDIIVPETLDEWLDDGEREDEALQWLQRNSNNNNNNFDNATLVDECAQARAPADPQARRVLHGLPAGLDEEFALQNLYDTVGLTDELSKTACLISISIHRRVPPQCDCTATATDDDNAGDDDIDVVDVDVVDSNSGGHGGNRNHNRNRNRGDPSFLDYDEPPVVLTERQRQAIAARTVRDQRLYDVATRLFWDRVARVERVYSFRMC